MKSLLLALALFAARPALASETGDVLLPMGTASPAGDPAPNDLAVDATFGGIGYVIADFNDNNGKKDVALRVFPASDGGYWIAGYHALLGIDEAGYLAVAKLNANGSFDTSYNGTGKRTFAATFTAVADVAIGPGDRLYFVGSHIASGASDTDIEIDCIDAAGNPCAGFLNAGTEGVVRKALDLGDASHLDDVPTRIICSAGNLYVVGTADTGVGTSNYAAFALKLGAASGAFDAGFGNMPGHAGLFVRNFDYALNGRDVANDILAYSTPASGVRLIMVGQVQRFTAPDVDGFINESVYADLGDSRQDGLARVIRRHNGGFVVAGQALDDTAEYTHTQLLMAAYRTDGMRDTAFGLAGDNGRVLLMVNSYQNAPFGLAERADTRDLIVGLNCAADTFGDGHALQEVFQFGASGIPLHAGALLDLPGTPMDTHGMDLALIGNQVLTAGVRVWSGFPAVDRDMAVARYVATDTIFADRFGGSDSD
jgi:hypothetical protein